MCLFGFCFCICFCFLVPPHLLYTVVDTQCDRNKVLYMISVL